MTGIIVGAVKTAHTNKNSLFLVQDNDCPYYVLALSFMDAIDKWRRKIVADSEGEESLTDPRLQPSGVALVAEASEILL